MIDKQKTKRRYNWTPLPKDAGRNGSRWSTLYVSLTPNGVIALSRFTHEALGSPDSYVIVYDADLNVLGLQPARLNVTRHAYAVANHRSRGGKRIYAYRLMREFTLYLDETVVFPRCFIDHTGTLILELNDVKAAARKRKKKFGY